jgi:hypothetical protein
MKPETLVRLVNKGSVFKSKWNGKDIEIPKDGHMEVVKGLADHFIKQSEDLEIQEIPVEPIDPKEPKNPLEVANRGKAFKGLKKASDK